MNLRQQLEINLSNSLGIKATKKEVTKMRKLAYRLASKEQESNGER